MNTHTTIRTFGVVLTLTLGSTLASAQVGGPFDLSWHSIDGGGVMYATGGAFALGGTLGQADASEPLTGGAFSLSGGFWPGATGIGPCNVADFAPPFGVLNFFDVQTFLAAFAAQEQSADLVDDNAWNFFDVQAFLTAFSAGCP